MTTMYAYYANGERVPREHFYQFACDPARSAVVEACAGAGKTWMLVSRILRALLDGAAPEEIVAITFTRKAAGEMRERLLEWLAEFAAADEDHRVEALVARGMGEAAARVAAPRLVGLQEALLKGGRPVEIRTFHGWFSQLLRAAPLDLLQAEGLSAELQLIEDEAEWLPPLWRRFHEAVLADDELRADYQAMTLARGRHSLREWLLAAFSRRVELRLADRAGVLAGSLPDVPEPLAPLAALRPRLAALAQQLGQAKGVKARDAATAIEQALGLGDDAARFAALWAALFTKTGTPKKGLGDSPEQLDAVEALERLAADIAQHEAAVEHGRMARLAVVLVQQFEALKAERGLVDMNDLERGALALLARPELAGWVQQRLGARIRHLLVDEFQDTSPLQWQALHGWLSAYAGAGSSSIAVFVVGDPKQSIYRFRRAEPRVFAAAAEFVREGLAGVTLACDHTRRNAAEVLDAVNRVFDGQLPGFRAHTTERAPEAGCGLFALDGPALAAAEGEAADPLRWRPSLTEPCHEAEQTRRAPECERVVALLRQLLAEGTRPGQVFVLARKREPLRQLAEALLAAGIPHLAPEDNRLTELPDAQDLIALLDALASPGHALSLARALRSPLFGLGEAELLQLAEAAGSVAWLGRAAPAERSSWWAALATVAARPDASAPLQRAQRLLTAWRAEAARCTPHELLDRIVHEGELIARLLAVAPPAEAAHRVQAVQALLQASLALDGGRFAELYGFVRALRARPPKVAPLPGDDAVQLLTVHGAKGLEAEVVILLDADAAPPKAETLSLAVDWPVDAAAPACLAFMASERRPPPSLQALVAAERELRDREELHALYVAMTRARRRLILSRTPPRRGASDGSWWARMAPLAQPLAPPEPTQAGPLPTHLPPVRALELPRWRGQAMPERDRGAADDAAQARLGEALHRALEWISAPGQRQPHELLIAASAQAFGLDAPARKRLDEAVAAILASPACQPFFDPARLRWAGNEVAIGVAGEDRRIDRLVLLDDGCWWVLDYKLGATPEHEPAYQQQLRDYVGAVRALQPGEPVKAALISGTGRFVECG